MSELTSPNAEAVVCLQAYGIDKNNVSVGRLGQACVLINDDRGVGRGRGIRDASEGLETTTEAAGSRQRARGIYNGNGGVGGGI